MLPDPALNTNSVLRRLARAVGAGQPDSSGPVAPMPRDADDRSPHSRLP